MRNMAFRGVVAFLAGGLYAGFLFVPGFAAGADAPQGTDKSFPSIREETQTVDVADWGFRDPADTPPNTFVAVTLTSLPAAGEVRVDGVPATNGQIVALVPGPAGVTWTDRDSSRNWYSVASSADGAKLAAAVRNGYLFTSTDRGTTWSAQANAGMRDWRSVASSADGTKLMAADYFGQIYTSTDSGTNWTARSLSGILFSMASSADGAKLVAADYGGDLHTSTNSGANWTARSMFQPWQSVASAADGTKLVAAAASEGSGGQLYTSTDTGATWTAQMNAGFREWRSVASSADGMRLVAAVYNGHLWTSTDSGTNWTARMTDVNRNWRSVASSADGTRLVAAIDGGQLYTSTNSGGTWTARATTQYWSSVASSADGTKLVAAVDGGQLYTSAGSMPAITYTAPATAGPNTLSFQVQDDGAENNIDLSPNTLTFNVPGVTDPLTWVGGDGPWDLTTAGLWQDGASASVLYTNDYHVRFTDAASVATPVIALQGVLQPASVTVDSAKNYTLTGSGQIGGNASLSKAGAGTLTISNANTYAGATIIGGGTLKLLGASVPPAGANVYLSFNDESDPWKNDANGAHPVTPMGAPTTTATGKSGRGLSLNGSSGLWVSAPVAPEGSQSMWIKTTSSQFGLFEWDNSYGGNDYSDRYLYYGINGWLGGGSRTLGSWVEGSQTIQSPVVTLDDNQWHHVVRVYGSCEGGQQIWVDGVKVVQGSYSPQISRYWASEPYFDIGKCYGIPNFSGTLDEFRNYPLALTPGQILALYQSGAGGGGSDVLPTTTRVELGAASGAPTLDLNGVSQQVASLADIPGHANGVVTSSLPATLTLGAASGTNTFSGAIGGAVSLVKSGAGTQVLSGANTHSGSTTVGAGALLVNGSLAAGSAVGVSGGAILGGSGSVGGAVTLTGTSRLAPGTSVGALSVGSVAWSGGTFFDVELEGAAGPGAAGGNDVLNVTAGPANLGGATLSISLNFTPASVVSFTILDKQSAGAVSGTFAGLPEGAAFILGDTSFQITYQGGDGNDVVLAATPVNDAPTDNGGADLDSATKTMTVNVTSVNDVPADILLSASSVAENQPGGTTVGILSATDPDAGDTATFALVGGDGSTDNGSFSISNGTNLVTAAPFNYESKSGYSIRVRVTDSGNATYEKAFAISVTNVKEAFTIIILR